MVTGTGLDKKGVRYYFVRAVENHVSRFGEDDLYLHGSRLPGTDKFFILENGTELLFKEKNKGGSVAAVSSYNT